MSGTDERASDRVCRFFERVRERDRVGVWGFGSVSKDVVLTLLESGLGKEIVFYGRPREGFPNRAAAWVDDLRANSIRRPRILGTNDLEDMAGLDVIFVGVGVPRQKGQSRSDLLAVNAEVLAKTSLSIRELYEGCERSALPILVYMGNPITAVTWISYKVTGFPRENVMGQAGNLDSRRICHALARQLGLSGNDMDGIVFGEHGDSMVATPSFFSVGGIPLPEFMAAEGVDAEMVRSIMEEAKKGGTHFVNEVGQSASAGPARAAVRMLRCIISGEPEVQSVVAVLGREYGLLKDEDGLDSFAYGVPAKIGPYGIEKIYELDVTGMRQEMERSADVAKQEIRAAAELLKTKLGMI